MDRRPCWLPNDDLFAPVEVDVDGIDPERRHACEPYVSRLNGCERAGDHGAFQVK